MSAQHDLQVLLEQWQAALKRRDRLQAVREGLRVARDEGAALQDATVEDVVRLLAEAEAEVSRLQHQVLAAGRLD